MKLTTCPMSHYLAHVYYQSYIKPKLGYPLVASSLSNNRIDCIQTIIHSNVIVSIGFNRNWPKELRYRRHKYSGLELAYFKVEQRLRKIQFLHKLLNHPTHKNVAQILIEWYQVELGLPGQILANPTLPPIYI